MSNQTKPFSDAIIDALSLAKRSQDQREERLTSTLRSSLDEFLQEMDALGTKLFNSADLGGYGVDMTPIIPLRNHAVGCTIDLRRGDEEAQILIEWDVNEDRPLGITGVSERQMAAAANFGGVSSERDGVVYLRFDEDSGSAASNILFFTVRQFFIPAR